MMLVALLPIRWPTIQETESFLQRSPYYSFDSSKSHAEHMGNYETYLLLSTLYITFYVLRTIKVFHFVCCKQDRKLKT